MFVCRAHGWTKRGQLFDDLAELGDIVREELAQLRSAGMKPSAGDIRCIVFGHLTRIAIWRLRKSWKAALPTVEHLDVFARTIADFGDPKLLIEALAAAKIRAATPIATTHLFAQDLPDAVSF